MNPENQIEPKKYSAVIKWSLIVGIVIVINLFLNYTISLIYSSPQYENYCKQSQVIRVVEDEVSCVGSGGQWNENIYDKPVVISGETKPIGYCDPDFTCRTEYDAERKAYDRNIFVILVVFGIVLVSVSFALAFNWILSVSASMSGILSIIIASMRYWGEADNWLRVVILFLALAILIYLAIKKFKN